MHVEAGDGGRPDFRASRSRRFERLAILAAGLLVGWFFFFTVRSSGDLHESGVNFDYYNLLIDGFRKGHLYLDIAPDPRLLALSDPYDPAQNDKVRLPDASYYHGRYYIYFGPTPAVTLMLPFALLTGHRLPQAAAVLVYCLLGIAAASALWLRLRHRHFPDSAAWIGPVGVLVMGLGAHVLACARRPEIWELPIAAGFGFTMLALLAVGWAIDGRRPVLAMAVAGLSIGLAVGARPPAILTVGMLVIATWQLWRSAGRAVAVKAAVAAAIPLGVLLAALAWYNYARFDSPFQFGQAYQLTSLREGAVKHFDLRFVWYNLRVYFAWPVRWTTDFPFLASRSLPPAPAGYFSGEELYWLAVLSPFLWFGPLALVCARNGAGGRNRFVVSVASIVAAALPLTFLLLCFFYAAERYMVDFVPYLMLLALGGLLVVERAAAGRLARVAFCTAAIAAAVVTIGTGVLASFDYHGRRMRETDPRTWQRISTVTERPVREILHLLEASPPRH
ncbi:MAG TPA: hypothetical protein VHE61_18205 [Opitutaceae bacterium]|nr:hypothetical protein [Opitutaceae bacterium]